MAEEPIDSGASPGDPEAGDDTSGGEQSGVVAAIEQIEAFVESDSVEVLETVLDRHLAGPITEETFRVVRDAGMLIMGDDGFGLVTWVASKPEQARALRALELSPAARSWLKGIIAVYGNRLNQALHRSDVLASKRDDWEGFGWNLRVDPNSGEYEINIEIQKYNGEKLALKTGLLSAVRLAEQALEPLMSVDSLSSVEEEDRQGLLEALDAVREKLTAQEPSAAEDQKA
jgi:hypothetical protein